MSPLPVLEMKPAHSPYQALWSKCPMRHKATNHTTEFYNSNKKIINGNYILILHSSTYKAFSYEICSYRWKKCGSEN